MPDSIFFLYFSVCFIVIIVLFSQVKTIRDALRKVGLGAIDVETIDNVQGRKFLKATLELYNNSFIPSFTTSDKIILEMLTKFVLTDPHVIYTVISFMGYVCFPT